jgi:mannose-6-phosphate isomerase-like protein (cupin superfamily)
METGMSMKTIRPEPVIVMPEQAEMIKAFGINMKILLTSEATGGAISVLIGWHKPGEGAPDHVHFSQNEMFYIIEGSYELTVDGRTSAVGPGAIVYIPANTVHRFRNIGTTTGCMLNWTLPGGHNDYFKAISELAIGAGLTADKVVEAASVSTPTFPPRIELRAAGRDHLP